MKNAPLVPLVAIAVTTQFLVSAPALAATSQNQERTATKLAAGIVADSENARTALASGNPGAATSDIDKALASRDRLAQTAKADGTSMVVPLYAELDDTAMLSDAVKNNAKDGRTVRANAAQLTYLAIDLDKAKSRLNAAQKAIIDKNDVAARASLAAVGSDLIEDQVDTDLPLLTAREDLSRAQVALRSNDTAAAKTDLRQASKSLKAYAGGPHLGDARALSARIAGATEKPSAAATMQSDIGIWWTSVKNWFATKT